MANNSSTSKVFDAVVIGGGPAGLSAALFLGRSRRRVLLADDGHPRNARAETAHSVFTRDGTAPAELRRIGRSQLAPYDVTVRDERVADIAQTSEGFAVGLDVGEPVQARKLLFATGVRDVLPETEGFQALWGQGVFQCPYCHGWEVADQPLALYGRSDAALELARLLSGWSRDLVLFTDGPAELRAEQKDRLAQQGITLREEPVARLLPGPESGLQAVVLEGGEAVPRSALFLRPAIKQLSDLPEHLGCTLTPEGQIEADMTGKTQVKGVYVAGDMARNLPQIISAASSGATAATFLNHELLEEEFGE